MNLRDQLQAIYEEQGQLTPKGVLDTARDPEHPLHNRFTWDDSEAAERWRLHEAHDLIVSVKVHYTDPKGERQAVRAYHCVPRENGFVYEPGEEIARDEVSTKIVLSAMEREWRQLKRRYSHFAEFTDMIRRDLDDEAAA